MKNFTIRITAAIVLFANAGLSAAYNDRYESVLRSLFNAKEASISVFISSRFFDPLESGESFEEWMKNNASFGEDEVDKSLSYRGRVPSNITALLSDKLQKNFSINTVDWKIAPYRAQVDIRVVQQLDIYGDNLFGVELNVDFQEAATTRTGHTGFMSVYHFNGYTFAKSKDEVETQIYIALDQAVEKMQKTFTEANDYCANASC